VPSPTELILLFQRAQAAVTDRVDAVEPGQWDREALPGWTVLDLVASLVAGQMRLVALLAGDDGTTAARRVPESAEELLEDDPLTAWETAADEALGAIAVDGALDRPVSTAGGEVSAAEHVERLTAELAVHAVDLARATGQDETLDPELAAAALEATERLGGEPVWGGTETPPTQPPAGADAQGRLLARHGRRP
jgi:uncharacterized protein (TIGR03086 family)